MVLKIGSWRVDPNSGCISQADKSVRLDGRTMKLLVHLADRAGDVVSVDELLNKVWTGVIVTQDSVYQAVASLRRMLGDDAKQPAYIATVPRLGYRLIASVRPWVAELDSEQLDSPPATKPEPAEHPAQGPDDAIAASAEVFPSPREDRPAAQRGGRKSLYAVLAALCVAVVAVALWHGIASRSATVAAPARSVAVMPILDLTSQKMDEEYFADGVTEELIDRLSKIPGMRVPSPASSFYFKDKSVSVAEFARSLGVTYVLSGSIRKSGTTQRVSARLVRASDGYIVWAESYDRPVSDELKVQDDIASHVATALSTSIH
ncbi:MAG TPA: winged helix-turn-helix domain-containing protein [Xanthomonadaceae bacterium]|jgi:transcriptional activator of cad operon|nr:winged helix-turn-helix domain-containing protein [Xanthomonadaceae bacterium]